MLKEPRILIIGAGASGISAACRLYERGLKNFIILEAKNRIGGRIFTSKFADNVVDLGAQWVHGQTENIVYNLVKSQELLDSSHKLNDTNKHIFVDSNGEFLPKSESSVIWHLYYSITDVEENVLKQQDGSYGDYFIKKFYEYFNKTHFTSETRAAQILEWMGKFDNSLQCSDTWFDVSAKGLAEYKPCDGDHVLNWKDRGYKTLFDILMHKHPDTSKALPIIPKIKFSTEVKSIDYSNPNEIIVSSTSGEEYKADNVIFTASLGVLKSEYSSLFIPKLPIKKEHAIKGLNIGSVNKIFLEFSQRWWPEDAADFEFLWTKEEKTKFMKDYPDDHWLLDVFGFFIVDYQPRVLCGWITSHGARVMETLTDEVIKGKIFWLLEKFLGKTYNIPWPERILTSRWYSDKHFRGCYTYRSLDSERMNVWSSDLADPILSGENNKPTILFAGEATHDHYYSTVHGAVETGFREADRLVDYYGKLKSHL